MHYMPWLHIVVFGVPLNYDVTLLGDDIDVVRYSVKEEYTYDKNSHESIHALVLLTLRDACPNIVIEAMSSGVPVITTNSGGIN